jgi:Ala-tRNA(Pro) deacylase
MHGLNAFAKRLCGRFTFPQAGSECLQIRVANFDQQFSLFAFEELAQQVNSASDTSSSIIDPPPKDQQPIRQRKRSDGAIASFGSPHAAFYICSVAQRRSEMPAKKLKEFLDSHHVKYQSIIHSTAYTAQEIASLVHIKGQELAKTVIVKLDDRMAMAVLPASRQVDLVSLRELARAKSVSLATEQQFRERFPECETGAMPPFGNLFGLPVFVEESLTRDREIAFNAGTHNELIRIAYADFARLVQPKVATFALAVKVS